jgi:hypothetical protein
MYEVSIDPRDSEGISVSDVAGQMWRFSREEIAKGTLDTLGEQTFTDGKVRKALDAIMANPPRSFLKIVRNTTDDPAITPQQIKNSLARISRGSALGTSEAGNGITPAHTSVSEPMGRVTKARRIRRATKSQSSYDEPHHTSNKPKEAVELYRAVDRLCLSLSPDNVRRRYLAKCIAYDCGKRAFCSVHILKNGLRIWLQLKYSRLVDPPTFARDVSNVGHWGAGDLELAISSIRQFEQAAALVRESFEVCAR